MSDGGHQSSALSWLLHPVPTQEFFDLVWGRDVRHSAGWPDRFAALLRWAELDDALRLAVRAGAPVRLLRAGAAVDAKIVVTDAGGRRRFAHSTLAKQLRDGATLVVDDFDEFHGVIGTLVEDLEGTLRVPVSATLRATWRSAEAPAPQREPYDQIVLQLSGSDPWKLSGPGHRDPARPASRGPWAGVPENAPPTDPFWDDDLCQGDAVYIPKGFWFAHGSGAAHSLSLALRFTNVAGVDLARWLAERLALRAVGRQPVPRFAGPLEQRAFVELVRKELTALATTENLTRFLSEHDRDVPARRHGAPLPWLVAPEALLDVDATRVHGLVRIPQAPRLTVDGTQVEFIGNGRTWRLTADHERLLTALASRRAWRIGELVTALSASADRSAVVKMLHTLEALGIIALVP